MLIEFSVENFRSIKKEICLSLVAQGGKELYKTNVMEPPLLTKKIPLLHSAALYGPNAGGKSNIIEALATMQKIIMTSSQQLESIPVTPFKLNQDSAKQPTVFEVIFLSQGVRYQYGFSATTQTIHEEWLFAFPKGRAQHWFQRSLNASREYEYQFSDKLTGDKDVWKRATRPNALFLSTAIQLNSQQLKPIFEWFSNTLCVIDHEHNLSPIFSIKCCQDNRKSKILDFLKAADFAISDVRVIEEDFSPETLPSQLPSSMKKFIESKLSGKKGLRPILSHPSETGEPVDFDLTEESDGTQKIFNFAGPWRDSLEKGRVLFIDELHDNLHPLLVKFLVQLFHNNETNPNHAQLVFSTHETSILSQDVFRRDQIWFCERDTNQATNLYPLTDFNPRKNVENLEKSYLSGRYGALPFLKDLTNNFWD